MAGADDGLIDREYSALLKAVAEKHGLNAEDLVGEGVSRPIAYRILNHTHRPTFKAAAKVANRLRELIPKEDADAVPPPAIAVRTSEHHDWCMYGSLLMTHDRELFEALFGEAAAVAGHLLKAEKNKEQALARLNAIAERRRSEPDG